MTIGPEPVDAAEITVRVNGNVVYEDADTLREPLQQGYAFFVQAYLDDYARGELSHD